MPSTLAASLLDRLLGMELGPIAPEAINRVSLDGLALGVDGDGALRLQARRLEAASLRVASGPLVLEIGRLALNRLAARGRGAGGALQWEALEAADAELSGVRMQGPVLLPAQAAGDPAAGAWCLGPLAAAEGTIRAEIVDAHLLFDADVTVPIRHGQVNFNHARVEHVGPDSRMGVSRLGLYVDAPNGRSYLYQFAHAPVAGVEYERRGALLNPLVSHRGKLWLQAFGEALLRQGAEARGPGFTEQARLLFERTAVSGELQLGDGPFGAPGVRAEVAGRAQGRNGVRLHSEAVGRGLTIEMPALSARDAVLAAGRFQLRWDSVAGALSLRLASQDAQLRFTLDVPSLKLAGLRLDQAPDAANSASAGPASR